MSRRLHFYHRHDGLLLHAPGGTPLAEFNRTLPDPQDGLNDGFARVIYLHNVNGSRRQHVCGGDRFPVVPKHQHPCPTVVDKPLDGAQRVQRVSEETKQDDIRSQRRDSVQRAAITGCLSDHFHAGFHCVDQFLKSP
ncbi:hypothetical protein D3C80_1675350 [compost metagenome]